MDYAPDGSMRMLGKPVVICDDAPAIGDGKYPVAFGDLQKAYAVGVHARQPASCAIRSIRPT